MKNISIFLIALLISAHGAWAQNAHFTKSGVIEFEKTANMFALMKKEINKDNEAFLAPAYEQYRKTQPQFKKLKSTLTFANNTTLFTPLPEETPSNYWGNRAMVGQNSTIFTDLNAHQSISQKKVYEETFLVKDSTRNIKWKITSETRNIAGYECRRANAIVMDSIYVVAFYTDEIPVSGGPESFSGLPGMILGVALPHENVTWFATKVTDMPVQAATLAAPKKGKAVDKKGFLQTLKSAMKDWGEYAQNVLKAYLL